MRIRVRPGESLFAPLDFQGPTATLRTPQKVAVLCRVLNHISGRSDSMVLLAAQPKLRFDSQIPSRRKDNSSQGCRRRLEVRSRHRRDTDLVPAQES